MNRKILLAAFCALFMFSAFAQSDSSKTYKLVVAFNSFATGVPAREPLIAAIKKFKKTYKIKKISADRIGPLGREGEYKLAFTLKELTAKQRRLFIAKVKKTTASMKERGSAVVTVDETIVKSDIPERATVEKVKY